MAQFQTSKPSQLSKILESIEQERAYLFAAIHPLLASLAAVFCILTIFRIGFLVFDFELSPVTDFRLPLITLWAAFLFLTSFVLVATAALIVLLAVSSSLGLAISSRVVIAIFRGSTTFALMAIWQSQLPWFFGNYFANPWLFNVIVTATMFFVTFWPYRDLSGRLGNKQIHIKHLMILTAVFAILLAVTQLLVDTSTATVVISHVVTYTFVQLIVLLTAWRWITNRCT